LISVISLRVGRRPRAAALSVAAFLLLAGSGISLATPAAAWASDTPTGFWYGTDSWPMNVGGAGPYREPVLGGSYGGYIGMVGSWESWLGCRHAFIAWSNTDATAADTNLHTYHEGVGAGAYWFMGGPGVDPHYKGTTQEAQSWGASQAARALADISGRPKGQRIAVRDVFMDIELPGISPAPDNGWDSVYTSPCSGQVKQSSVPAVVDRAEFNGFWSYIYAHSSYRPAVYSAPGVWSRIFGTGSASNISVTDEWTYEPETSNLGQAPSGWCLRGGGCARFFGGVTSSSKHAVMWQWSGGGGVRNGYGDFDQIDRKRML
jgi:hypothetical protein